MFLASCDDWFFLLKMHHGCERLGRFDGCLEVMFVAQLPVQSLHFWCTYVLPLYILYMYIYIHKIVEEENATKHSYSDLMWKMH